MNDEQIWKPVVGYEHLYEVSNQGRVRSLERMEECRPGVFRRRAARLLKLRFDLTSSGYSFVTLSSKGQPKKVNVHVLVLEAFISCRPSPEHEACHGNGDRTDARLTNLRWDTSKGNAEDRKRHGTHLEGMRNPRSVLTEQDVRLILISKLSSIKLAKQLGVASSTVRAVRNGQNWKAFREGKS